MQNGSSETLNGWKSGKTTYVTLWDRMEGAWLWTQALYPIYRPGKAVGGGFVVYVFSTYVLTHTMTMAHRIYKVF
jgi:hypothetical protein